MHRIYLLLAFGFYSLSGTSQTPGFNEEEISFVNDDIMLSGTLLVPDEKQKMPAIVFLHGSGPHERAGFRPYAEEFAKLGFASLFFDKRGTGSSGGSWITSSLDDLANDAVAAVEFLKNIEGVDSDRIGFWGVSQAGWVAPYAAAMSGDVAFMILISGGGASPYESEHHSYNQWFSAMNFSEQEKDQSIKLIDDYMQYLKTGLNREELAEKLEAVSNKNVNMLAKQLGHILPSTKNRTNWEWVATYDPMVHLQQLEIPVLVMTGDQDGNHPHKLATENWRKAFTDRHELLSVITFPGAGHGIRIGGHGESRPFADGYWEVQFGWLYKNIMK